MSKLGRKPKFVPRETNGRAQRNRDGGTEQLQARREWLAGEGDMTKTIYPLGILLANGAITDDAHSAGCRLAWLYAMIFGKVSIGAAAFERGRGKTIGKHVCGDGGECEQCGVEVGWRKEVERTLKALSGISRHVRDDIVSLVVYERVPNFMRPGFPTLADRRHAERVKAGLMILAGDRRVALAAG